MEDLHLDRLQLVEGALTLSDLPLLSPPPAQTPCHFKTCPHASLWERQSKKSIMDSNIFKYTLEHHTSICSHVTTQQTINVLVSIGKGWVFLNHVGYLCPLVCCRPLIEILPHKFSSTVALTAIMFDMLVALCIHPLVNFWQLFSQYWGDLPLLMHLSIVWFS